MIVLSISTNSLREELIRDGTIRPNEDDFKNILKKIEDKNIYLALKRAFISIRDYSYFKSLFEALEGVVVNNKFNIHISFINNFRKICNEVFRIENLHLVNYCRSSLARDGFFFAFKENQKNTP